MYQSPQRHSLRRIAVGVLAATATVAALAGCGSSGGNADGTTEITLSMQNPDVETADPATWAIVEAFEEANPDIDVTVSGEAVSEHLQKLSIAAQSDTLPDVFWVYKSTAEEMQEAGKLLDLAPVLDELDLTDSFPESTISNFSADEVIYGVPYQGLLTGLWVNEKILADNGLEVPVTFDDLVNVANALSAKGITTISNGANQSSFSVWSFLVDLDRFGFEEKVDGILDGSESTTTRTSSASTSTSPSSATQVRSPRTSPPRRTSRRSTSSRAATQRCSTPASGRPAPSRTHRSPPTRASGPVRSSTTASASRTS